ncbi:MAG: NAD-dependent epimerase/dehydratase family protein [Leuconostoc mesenteroides]|uniref:Nucleoside-diphosphate-sugar epimerase n=1 Tax=Leuconostoc mesenteroides subsp. mesenteroides (strain ATCC 8293 / DSM 20343 / BCRC 11652 / CCM 1803 / JCM 6124 / NCDO 523 / NBRC 100496 / NCIMB 8023 / NCTC 12954 / NRRL B-1118 / 37Y) TaxID=203120 RepID=Q03W81_LEUMM|nr:NAD-dependent epimerase/dehydratase family protein [Leuconostoc mesenteroides]ABJ62541.1 Nucleoside-diphosphate-sugar epimerase [Leuconostoc mesenteroides subsp. mesenteroides ATCC 8293]MCT3042225.1 NAD-dependent epimerase/dehydratase family protein [Leuconostoc mesenteroides]MDG9746547.1 NAD-dependent epimerase/dehydratase family protein [Leuconostoc mesenteroides]QAR69513.1 NAD-dependent epimerase/dehydratase family protein [Leuconostoc mesenteroides]QQB30688.1 NAD-dependent epimerase/deh
MDNKKIIVVGGTGFVGQGVLSALNNKNFELHSLSRHQFIPSDATDQVTYHAADLNKPGEWQDLLREADWVVDAVGILLPNPFKHINYQNSSVQPAQRLLDVLATTHQTKFLFVSANVTPFFLNAYLRAKLTVEHSAKALLNDRAYNVYPGIVYDKSRIYSYIPAIILVTLQRIPGLKFLQRYRPVSRKTFAIEVENILNGKESALLKRNIKIK